MSTRDIAQAEQDSADAAGAALTRTRLAEEAAELREVKLHGHTVGYRQAGEGPLLVLLHGITSSGEAWRHVMPKLAEHYTVIAPDLLGHGRSAKPRGDYSLGAYAAGIRDLLAVSDFTSGTVVGHSFGGGIALQFAYLFPERVERIILVAAGGLGREVHPLLRSAALPGSEWVMPLIARQGPVRAGEAIAAAAGKLGIEAGPDLAEFARGYASLAEQGARDAFLHTMKGVIGPDGQRVSALDRIYLADQIPTLIMWGTEDPIIPVDHGRNAHELVSRSRYIEFEGSGHWPMLDRAEEFTTEIIRFIEGTEPFSYDEEEVRDRLKRGPDHEIEPGD